VTNTACSHSLRRITDVYTWTTEPRKTYRFRCYCCNHTWSIHLDLTTNTEIPITKQRKRLTPQQVHFILTEDGSAYQKARQLGVSPQCVSQVLLGQIHKDAFPEIPRRISSRAASESCRTCTHWWAGSCDLSIPEAGSAGFASECSYFKE
jgi:hypothetical protein